MMAKTANRGASSVSETEQDRRLYMVRLESEAEELDTHDLFVQSEDDETARRKAMVAQLKERVAAGTYQPNVVLIAERILAERR